MTDEMRGERLAWGVRQFSTDFSVGESTVRKWIHDGTCPAVKIGGRVLIPGVWVRDKFADAMAEWSRAESDAEKVPA